MFLLARAWAAALLAVGLCVSCGGVTAPSYPLLRHELVAPKDLASTESSMQQPQLPDTELPQAQSVEHETGTIKAKLDVDINATADIESNPAKEALPAYVIVWIELLVPTVVMIAVFVVLGQMNRTKSDRLQQKLAAVMAEISALDREIAEREQRDLDTRVSAGLASGGQFDTSAFTKQGAIAEKVQSASRRAVVVKGKMETLMNEVMVRAADFSEKEKTNLVEKLNEVLKFEVPSMSLEDLAAQAIASVSGAGEQQAEQASAEVQGTVEGLGDSDLALKSLSIMVAGASAPHQIATIQGTALPMVQWNLVQAMLWGYLLYEVNFGGNCDINQTQYVVGAVFAMDIIAAFTSGQIYLIATAALKEMKVDNEEKEATKLKKEAEQALPGSELSSARMQEFIRSIIFDGSSAADSLVAMIKLIEIEKSCAYIMGDLIAVLSFFTGSVLFYKTIVDEYDLERECQAAYTKFLLHSYALLFGILLLPRFIAMVVSLVLLLVKVGSTKASAVVAKVARNLDKELPVKIPLFQMLVRTFVLKGGSTLAKLRERHVTEQLEEMAARLELQEKQLAEEERRMEIITLIMGEPQPLPDELAERQEHRLIDALEEIEPIIAIASSVDPEVMAQMHREFVDAAMETDVVQGAVSMAADARDRVAASADNAISNVILIAEQAGGAAVIATARTAAAQGLEQARKVALESEALQGLAASATESMEQASRAVQESAAFHEAAEVASVAAFARERLEHSARELQESVAFQGVAAAASGEVAGIQTSSLESKQDTDSV